MCLSENKGILSSIEEFQVSNYMCMLTRLESFKVHSPLQTQEKWGQLYQAHANKVPSIFDLKLLLIVLMENDILTDQTNSKRCNIFVFC